jgi:hypothetical protein
MERAVRRHLQAGFHVLAQGGFAQDRRKTRWQNDGIVCPKRKDTFKIAAFGSSERPFGVTL